MGYVVEYKPEGAYKWITAADDVVNARYEVKGLEDDMSYDFRVAAKNKMGIGKYSQCGMTVKARSPISKSLVLGCFYFCQD